MTTGRRLADAFLDSSSVATSGAFRRNTNAMAMTTAGTIPTKTMDPEASAVSARFGKLKRIENRPIISMRTFCKQYTEWTCCPSRLF